MNDNYNHSAEAQVHYWELQQYNEGHLVGRWFTLDGLTKEEHREEVQNWLKELTNSEENTEGNLYEEWILGDAEGVPAEYVDTYGIDEDFFKLQEAVSGSCYGIEVFKAGIALGIDLDKITEAYYGQFEDDEDFARGYADGTGMFDGVPDYVRMYFDYESFGRDLTINDYMEEDGYYFSRHW